MKRHVVLPLALLLAAPPAGAQTIALPDTGLVTTYERAARQNVLAALNPGIFFGYWSVCADGQGFGYGNTYPSLDGHQMSDALLWLGRTREVKANFDYVRSFQRDDGLLPLAIFPSLGGKDIGPKGLPAIVDSNGGLYIHWVPGNPLEALAGPTYIQNADVIYRATLDTAWLRAHLTSVNRAADFLASLVTPEGAVTGGGYYVERPPRLTCDGVTQCYAVDAFERTALLNRIAGDAVAAERYGAIAGRIRSHFVTAFWVGDHFAEYWNPDHGLVSGHGLTDVDWAAIATGAATPPQQALLWPQLRDEALFHYGGVPTGIATHPEKYEAWEFNYDRHDLAAMGRVWYLEAWARAKMGDAPGLLAGLRKVSQIGRDSGYVWRERYEPDGRGGTVATGPRTYCEYPANFIRVIQRFLFGVDLGPDGSVTLSPAVTPEFWDRGFGQSLNLGGRSIVYMMSRDTVKGTYAGARPLRLGVRLPAHPGTPALRAVVDGVEAVAEEREGMIFITVPASGAGSSRAFTIARPGG